MKSYYVIRASHPDNTVQLRSGFDFRKQGPQFYCDADYKHLFNTRQQAANSIFGNVGQMHGKQTLAQAAQMLRKSGDLYD